MKPSADAPPDAANNPAHPGKAAYVRDMFGASAPRYDLLNKLLSFGIDKGWRDQAVAAALQDHPERILDVATGTADLAIALKRAAPNAEIIGVDFAEPMLALGRRKIAVQALDLELLQGDGQNLNFADGAFDSLTIAYGLRNFADRARGLQEFYRVLKPGGRLVVFEFPPPPEGVFGTLFRFYFLKVTPYLAGAISGRRDAYEYLGESVLEFPPPRELADMMRTAGFTEVKYTLQTYGVSALHQGVKP
ncbi:bifunctional demethylmenaquinone methyltransferase/2-methoxy-6-polyprenyl-1,4-benzoquinol methylase UbiE [soil metagenome]